MKIIPNGIKIISIGNMLLGGFSAFLGMFNMLSVFYFKEPLVKAFFFFCFFSFLTFWFFAFAKLNRNLNRDLIGFNAFSLFFATVILPSYKFFIYFQIDSTNAQSFEEMILMILNKTMLPIVFYSIWSIFYTKLFYSRN